MDHLPPPGERLPLGDLLRRIREGSQVSVDRLAQAAGKSAAGLRGVESGALSLSLRQLGTILGALRAMIGTGAAKKRDRGALPADLRYEFLRLVLGSAEFPREAYLRFLADRLEIDMELLVAGPFLEAQAVRIQPKQTLSESLRDLRQSSNLSIEQLAEQLHLAPNALERIEQGRANLSLHQLGTLLEAFAKYSPQEPAAGSKEEEDRLLAAFRRMDHASRTRFLRRLEGLQETAGNPVLEPLRALESSPKKA